MLSHKQIVRLVYGANSLDPIFKLFYNFRILQLLVDLRIGNIMLKTCHNLSPTYVKQM